MTTIVQDLAALERLHEDFGFRYDELAQALNTNETTLHRWRKGVGGEPTPVYVKRLEALKAFLEELDALFAEGGGGPGVARSTAYGSEEPDAPSHDCGRPR